LKEARLRARINRIETKLCDDSSFICAPVNASERIQRKGIMYRRLLLLASSSISRGILGLLVMATLGLPLAQGQIIKEMPAPNPDADAALAKFSEDWTTPSVKTSKMLRLKAEGPLGDTTHEGYTVELWRLTWRPGDPIEVYVIKPTGVNKPPVILNLWGYPNDLNPYKLEAVQKEFVKGGFAAVGFASALTGQRYHDLPLAMWFLSQLPESVAATAHDVQLMIDFMEIRGDLDTSRIGMFGNGSGGAIGILASAVDPRIKVLDVLDPWADWPTWLSTSPFPPADERANYVKPEFLKSVLPLEPLDWLPKIQAKKFRFQDDEINPETPAPIKEKIRKAAPAGTTVVEYKSKAELMAAFQHSCNLDWLKQQLSTLPSPDKVEETSAEKH
jgi:hypothetical protein